VRRAARAVRRVAERLVGPSDGEIAAGTPIYIDNAGVVMLAPYLPQFFDRLGVLGQTEAGTAAPPQGIEAASRAVHMLQYLVEGRTDRPEPVLVLNKLLAGLPPETPIEAVYRPSEADQAMCLGLLRAAIRTWGVIDNSTPDALQEAFLQRPGRLERGDARWTLTVERKTLDVLMDRLPWGFSVVLHPWMKEPVHVTW